MYKFGDIVLTPFPFTDLSGNKVRPALILGIQEKGNDVTVCFVSSIPKNTDHKFDIAMKTSDVDFKKTGLKSSSVIKTTKIATLDKIVILGKIGELDIKNIQKVKKILRIYFGL